MRGFWVLEGSDPPLYTRKLANRFRDKRTGRIYKRGELKIFWNGDSLPRTIEETDNFEYDYGGFSDSKKKPNKPTEQELLQEIATSNLIQQTRGRR